MLNLVRLFNLYADPNGIDASLNQNPLVLIPGNDKRVEDDFGSPAGLNFRGIVSFGGLGCKVAQRDCCRQGRPNAFEVRSKRLRLDGIGYEVSISESGSSRKHALRLTMMKTRVCCADLDGDLEEPELSLHLAGDVSTT